ncbi:MAG: macrocin O-methyltransferase [Terrimonas sp.]|nr:macrocin O-methyltransferase [Terrimonas sp.]
MIVNLINRVIGITGYSVSKKKIDTDLVDIESDRAFMRLYDQCRPYTMTSMERLYSLYQSVIYILDHNIPGDFVECGVWKGGSSMMMALTLLQRNATDRSIFLYDTFEGMSAPTENDITFSGQDAEKLLQSQEKDDDHSIWCYSPLENVQGNLKSTGYPSEKLFFIKGKVEITLHQNLPAEISLLRLDTDWYESTKIELEMLYPLLKKGGVLIIDDFGHWEGAKKAVLEYFKEKMPILHRIDNTGRITIK